MFRLIRVEYKAFVDSLLAFSHWILERNFTLVCDQCKVTPRLTEAFYIDESVLIFFDHVTMSSEGFD